MQIWNKAYSRVCGEKHPREFASDYRECWASAWPAIGGAFETARNGETAFLENQPMFLDRNGYLEETWFTFSLSPIRDETGAVVGLFHPVAETTARMLADRRTRALRDLGACAAQSRSVAQATELTLAVLSNYSLDLPLLALFITEEDGGLRLAGQTADALPPGLETVVADVVSSGETRHVTALGAHAGPHEEPLEQALFLPISPPGAERPAGVLVAGISTRLPLDETYRGFFDLVAQGVTSALANAIAYEQERARAEALADIDRAKTAFFSNVSHEFRTPLTLMLGPLEEELACTDRELSPESRERLATAHRNSMRLLRLVNSLLDFSRVESGRVHASYVPTDLAAYTADLASLFRSAIEKADLELIIDCEPLPEPLFVDHEMWEKVVLNLLSNAFKHTFDGRITVALHPTADGAELTVSDTGIGIPADELPRLFERFHRVRDARARTFEGTGIGLSLVRELARLHGGEATIESEPGRGSTFSVTVRAGHAHLAQEQLGEALPPAFTRGALAEVQEAQQWLATTETGAPTSERGGPRPRVLLADDNEDMRRHVTRVLDEHFEVHAVADGEAALEAVFAQPPDLVLTDVMMPRLDGFGLLAALRADERTRAIPVIMLSARAGEEAAVEGIDAGADDYLIKPFSARELVARIAGTLALGRLRQESALRLEQVNRELAAAARSKSEFVANMSHEIRTPLNAIIGMTSLLQRSPLDGAQSEYAEVIRASGEHLLNLVGDVLDFSKIEAGAIRVERAPLNIRECVQAAIDIASVPAKAKGIALISHVAPEVPEWVIGDSSRLRQILINLLANAVKFTASGQVALTATATQAGQHLADLGFAISDTGIGIAESDQATLFDAFVQVDGSSTRAHQGAGLGLAISAQLAGLMGGAIAVQSTLGEGSTFTVSLPAPLVDEPATLAPPAPATPPATPLSVLIVDDNRANQRVTGLLLKELGYASDTAGNGIEAIEALERQRYDIVFMDVQMPELDGLAATRIIRRRWPGPNGPTIVGLSGYASSETRHECLAAGMNDYLVKPVSLAHFADALARFEQEAAAPESGRP